MDQRVSALIIARSARIRNSLFVLSRSVPQIETVHCLADGPSALAMGPEVQPALVLLDYDLPADELRATLDQISVSWPQARCVVFVDYEEDRQPVLEAGADAVLVKGIRADEILEAIEGLL